jgi:DNA repair exonuclease SbcCD nuclease subunit
MAERRPATLLHTSDVHLDRHDGGHHQQAFAAMVDLAIAAAVDAVLIVGDLFDHARVRDDILGWTAEQLNRLERPVVLLVGNHDALHDQSVHHRFDASSRCRNVLFLDHPEGSVVDIPGTDLEVWGRAMIEHEPAFEPLAGVPAARPDKWTVIAGHGLVIRDEFDRHRSSPIFPGSFDGLDCDYVALGHLHEHAVVHTDPLACYSGATARSHQGRAGCVIVDFATGRAPDLRWVALPAGSAPTTPLDTIERVDNPLSPRAPSRLCT